MEYVITKTLEDGDIKDILTTAFEGGVGYWAVLDNTTPEFEESRRCVKAVGQEGYVCDIILHMLGAGDKVKLLDAESEDLDDPDNVWEFGMDDFKKGCALYEINRGSIRKTLDDGAFDAIEADCLIQYAVFGEIIYG